MNNLDEINKLEKQYRFSSNPAHSAKLVTYIPALINEIRDLREEIKLLNSHIKSLERVQDAAESLLKVLKIK